jgi:hypothetical protein
MPIIDPIVTISSGVPVTGSGQITTLGMTLVDGANITTGALADLAVTAGAAGTLSAKLRSISRDLVGGVVLQSGANTIGAVSQNGNWLVQGTVASGATDSGNPVEIGGLAKTTNPTAVTDGQRVAATFDKQGKLVAVGALRQLKGRQKTSITTNTATTVVTAGGAGVFNDVYAIVLTNKSATNVFVDFSDGSGVVITLAAPANDTRGFTVTVDSAIPQASTATGWTATVSSAVTSIEVSMFYVSNL